MSGNAIVNCFGSILLVSRWSHTLDVYFPPGFYSNREIKSTWQLSSMFWVFESQPSTRGWSAYHLWVMCSWLDGARRPGCSKGGLPAWVSAKSPVRGLAGSTLSPATPAALSLAEGRLRSLGRFQAQDKRAGAMGLLAEHACPSVFIPLTAPLPGVQMVCQEPADGFHINNSKAGLGGAWKAYRKNWELLYLLLVCKWAGLFQGSLWSHQGGHVSAHPLFIQVGKGPRY